MRADAILTELAGLAGLALANWMSSVSGLSVATEYALSAGFVVYGLVVFGLAALYPLGARRRHRRDHRQRRVHQSPWWWSCLPAGCRRPPPGLSVV